MSDTFFMHYCQPLEKLLDHHLRITFIPPIAVHKGLRYISYGDILHGNVHIVRVLKGAVELNEPLILPICQTELQTG